MSLVMGLVNLVSIPAESDDIVTQVDGSHFSKLAWPTMQPSPQHAHTVIQFPRKEAICPKSGSSSVVVPITSSVMVDSDEQDEV